MAHIQSNRPPIVDPGQRPVIFATGIVAIDRAAEYVQITFCQDQLWGGLAVKEREVQGRVIVTMAGLAELMRALGEACPVH